MRKTLSNANRRKRMLKREHQKVMHRRRVFIARDLFEQVAKAS